MFLLLRDSRYFHYIFLHTVNMYMYVHVGGVIEDNEVFDNHFDGICLATGVKPQLSGKNDVH